MADFLVTQRVYVSFGFETLGKHVRIHLVAIENENSAFCSSCTNESALLFDDVNLHALLHGLADRDQILRYGWYMQDILNEGFVAFFPEWDFRHAKLDE